MARVNELGVLKIHANFLLDNRRKENKRETGGGYRSDGR